LRWLADVRTDELPNILAALVKRPGYDQRLVLPKVRKAAELVAGRLEVRLLSPQRGDGKEAEKIRTGYWRAAGKWISSCSCSKTFYPCYGGAEGLFDALSCFPFSHKVHYTVVPVAPTEGADIKFPWFFTRAYHFARGALLGVSPPRRFFDYVRPYYGPGWYNAMEAGLRALNLAFSLSTVPYKVDVAEQLLAALAYIPVNLEVGIYTSNHLMSDLYGLAVSSLVLGTAWRPMARFSWRILEPLAYELNKQLDGWDYEGATAYHLLVLEGALATLYVASMTDRRYAEKLWSMTKAALKEATELLASITLPDGSFPLIGDNGSDRALVLESLELDYTSSITALALAKRLGLLEAFPKLEGKAREEAELVLRALDAPYPEEGSFSSSRPWLHSYNDGRLLVTLACARSEKGAPTGHHHDDKGSFTIWKDGWVVVDPGVFTYTGMKNVRDLMRSHFFHSTLKRCCSFPGAFSARCEALCRFYGYMKVEVVEGWKREISIKNDRVMIKDILNSRGSMSLMLVNEPEETPEGLRLPNAMLKLPGSYEVKEAFFSPAYGILRKGYLVRVHDVGPGEAVTEVVL